jgi:hypothetical protein
MRFFLLTAEGAENAEEERREEKKQNMVSQLIFSSFYPLANPLLNIRYIRYKIRCRTS